MEDTADKLRRNVVVTSAMMLFFYFAGINIIHNNPNTAIFGIFAITNHNLSYFWMCGFLILIYMYLRYRHDENFLKERLATFNEYREFKERTLKNLIETQVVKAIKKMSLIPDSTKGHVGHIAISCSKQLTSALSPNDEVVSNFKKYGPPTKVELREFELRLGFEDLKKNVSWTIYSVQNILPFEVNKFWVSGELHRIWSGTCKIGGLTVIWPEKFVSISMDNEREYIFDFAAQEPLRRFMISALTSAKWRLLFSKSMIDVFLVDYLAYVAIAVCAWGMLGQFIVGLYGLLINYLMLILTK